MVMGPRDRPLSGGHSMGPASAPTVKAKYPSVGLELSGLPAPRETSSGRQWLLPWVLPAYSSLLPPPRNRPGSSAL